MKFIDLTGKKFNRLTVVKYIGASKWECRCDCGNTTYAYGKHLKNGMVKSCGCYKREVASNRKLDLTNKRFGRLTALNPVGKKLSYILWHCKCDCGNEVDVTSTSLVGGNTQSCGCLQKERVSDVSRKNLTNVRFGKLVAMYVYKKDKWQNCFWLCKCDCGEERIVSENELVNGNVEACLTCMAIKKAEDARLDISGMVFGYLTAISRDNERSLLGNSIWKCRCKCGNITHVALNNLRNGHTTSCGCLSISSCGSKEENEIKDYIISLVSDTVIEKSRILDGKEIDIYLPEYNLGIEYNGSAFHATEGNIHTNKDKYYHRDKFLLAKEKGIHLISVFDIDYETNKDKILSYIKDCIFNTVKHESPTEDIMYTNNDYDDGLWLKKYGYKEAGQVEPESFESQERFIVYRSGKTKWVAIK